MLSSIIFIVLERTLLLTWQPRFFDASCVPKSNVMDGDFVQRMKREFKNGLIEDVDEEDAGRRKMWRR